MQHIPRRPASSSAKACPGSLTHPLLDCMLYLTQYLCDPGMLPSSANQCILGNVYLRSNLPREHLKMQGQALHENTERSPSEKCWGSAKRRLGLIQNDPTWQQLCCQLTAQGVTFINVSLCCTVNVEAYRLAGEAMIPWLYRF